MTDVLRILIFLYFIAYFGIAFIVKSIWVAKKIGKTPLVLPTDDSAYGLIGVYFKFTLISLFLYTSVLAFAPDYYSLFFPLVGLEALSTMYIGIILLVLSLVWILIAQHHMRDSWRIGIDVETNTELITDGLFKYSRNPIFFGMLVTLFGLFLTTPNVFTGVIFMFAYVLIQLQIRLEEEFLIKEHGSTYFEYMQRVRRYI